MAIKVAINGFGRIGRMVLRALAESGRTDIQIVGINDPGDMQMNAHLLRFDSSHGPFPGDVSLDGNILSAGPCKNIHISTERDPAKLPWGDLDVDIAFECTGLFKARDKAQAHIDAGAKRVLISAPGTDSDATIVYGVNHDILTADDIIVSNASCTTNCLAPVAKVLNDLAGIERGYMSTVHAYTGDQRVLDSLHKDPRRARACGQSIIPTTTGATKALGLVLPELAGKLDGMAMRVPTPNVSVVDLTVDVSKAVTEDAINDAMTAAANGAMKGVLAVNDLPLVSIDHNHNPASSVFDLHETRVLDGKFVRVMTWYDNEWGFSNRMLDTAAVMGGLL